MGPVQSGQNPGFLNRGFGSNVLVFPTNTEFTKFSGVRIPKIDDIQFLDWPRSDNRGRSDNF